MKLLLFAFLVFTLPANGDELGRLFTSSEQRASLDQARDGSQQRQVQEDSRGFIRKKGSDTIVQIGENSVDQKKVATRRKRGSGLSQEEPRHE